MRIAIFSRNPPALQDWRPWLEQNYEVTLVSTDQSLVALLETWQPVLLIYHEQKIREDFLRALVRSDSSEKKKRLPFGLIIAANSYSMRDELLAFEIGADHFLLASSPIASIKARVESLVSKTTVRLQTIATVAPSPLPRKTTLVQYKNLVIRAEQNCVQTGSQIIRITPTQLRLLLALVQNAGNVLTREWLQNHVFDGAAMSKRSIDAHLAKLKRAVPELRGEIMSVYGKGYTIRPDDDSTQAAS